MTTLADYSLEPDLTSGVYPISAAASRLARLIKQAHQDRCVFAVTQKGYPQAVIMDVELFALLTQLADATVRPAAAEEPGG